MPKSRNMKPNQRFLLTPTIDQILKPIQKTRLETLAIVHRVVEAHEGTIVAGNCEDGGAKFEIRI